MKFDTSQRFLIGRAKLEWNTNTIHKVLKFSVLSGNIKNKQNIWKTALVFKKQQGTLLGMGTFQKIVCKNTDLESRSWHGAPALSCLLCISTVCSQGNEDI